MTREWFYRVQMVLAIALITCMLPTQASHAQSPDAADERPSHLWDETRENWLPTLENRYASQIGTAADSGENVDLVAQLGESAYAVAVEGNYAYLGVGPRLEVIDISNPTNPSRIGQSEPLPRMIYDVFIVGSTAYVANESSGLYIFDISDPTNPQIADSVDTPGFAVRVFVQGDLAYVADGNSLQIVDLSATSLIGSIQTSGDVCDVYVAGSHAYVADGNSGLIVIDVANPAHPDVVGFYDPGTGWVNSVVVSGNHAFLSNTDDSNAMVILDISEPNNLSLVSSYELHQWSGNCYGVWLDGSYAYLFMRYGQIEIVDVTNATEPSYVGGNDVYYNTCRDFFAFGDYVYTAVSSSGMRIIDVSDPSDPFRVGSYRVMPAWNFDISESNAYLVAGGLFSVQMSDPAQPTIVAKDYSASSPQDIRVLYPCG